MQVAKEKTDFLYQVWYPGVPSHSESWRPEVGQSMEEAHDECLKWAWGKYNEGLRGAQVSPSSVFCQEAQPLGSHWALMLVELKRPLILRRPTLSPVLLPFRLVLSLTSTTLGIACQEAQPRHLLARRLERLPLMTFLSFRFRRR